MPRSAAELGFAREDLLPAAIERVSRLSNEILPRADSVSAAGKRVSSVSECMSE